MTRFGGFFRYLVPVTRNSRGTGFALPEPGDFRLGGCAHCAVDVAEVLDLVEGGRIRRAGQLRRRWRTKLRAALQGEGCDEPPLWRLGRREFGRCRPPIARGGAWCVVHHGVGTVVGPRD